MYSKYKKYCKIITVYFIRSIHFSLNTIHINNYNKIYIIHLKMYVKILTIFRTIKCLLFYNKINSISQMINL